MGRGTQKWDCVSALVVSHKIFNFSKTSYILTSILLCSIACRRITTNNYTLFGTIFAG